MPGPPQAAGRVSGSERAGGPGQGRGRGLGVERRRVGEHGGVHLGVRQAKVAPEDMADLVVHAHPGAVDREARQPGAVEGLVAGVDVAGCLDAPRQGGREGAQPLLGEQPGDRPDAVGVERLHTVGGGVQPAGGRKHRRQGQGEQRVVDDRLGAHAGVAAGGLAPGGGDAPDRRHLAAGVGGRDGEDRHPGLQGDRLGEPGRRPAADAHERVGGNRPGQPQRLLGHLLGDVLHHLADARADPLSQAGRHLVGGGLLRGTGDQQHRPAAEPADLVGHLRDRAGAEHDSAGGQLLDHRVHGVAGVAAASVALQGPGTVDIGPPPRLWESL
jgi:hypothetical protein